MDAASDVSSGSGADDQLVCRDFLRNVCRRGRRCKFPHPEEEPAAPPPPRPELVTFCHDFQNGQCSRPSCRFVHCERGDEDLFRRTGDLPSHVLEAAVMRGADIRVGRNEVPVCKDFARGECARSVKCKFRHLNVSELEQLCGGGDRPPPDGSPDSRDCEPPEAKRRHFDDYSRRGVVVRDYRQTPLSHEPNPHSIIDYRLIEDEKRILQRRVQELQKQVDDLTTTNEFLLDQNAQMRLAKQSAGGAGVTTLATVSVPSVSMAAGSGGVPASPMTMCPISQSLVAQGATAQVVTVPGSMGAVPVTLTHTPGSAGTISVSLAAPVTINQQGAVVSMASMANMNHQAAVASMNSMNPMAVSMASMNQPVAASMASMANMNQAAVASMNSMNSMNPMAVSMASMNQPVAASMANMNQAAVASMNSMNPMVVSMASMNQPVAASMASMANMTQAAAASMASMNPMAAATMAANQPVFQPAASMASINQPVAASMASMASMNEAAVATMTSMNNMAAASMASMPQPVVASMASMNPMAAASMASINQSVPVASMASINSANVAAAVLR